MGASKKAGEEEERGTHYLGGEDTFAARASISSILKRTLTIEHPPSFSRWVAQVVASIAGVGQMVESWTHLVFSGGARCCQRHMNAKTSNRRERERILGGINAHRSILLIRRAFIPAAAAPRPSGRRPAP